MNVYLKERAVRRSINKRARKRKLTPLDKNQCIAELIIKNIQSLEIPKMEFDNIVVNNSTGRKAKNLLLASIPLSGNHALYINREWVFHILYHWDRPGCKDALRITIGHEMSHKYDINMHSVCPRRHCLNKKINEVFADFHAAKTVANSDKGTLVRSSDYKLQRYKDVKMKDKAHWSHPSWEQRKAYAEIGIFNKNLIYLIASDAKFKNKKFIEKISERYSENIELY